MKQTIEEAARDYSESYDVDIIYDTRSCYTNKDVEKGFIAGAKWQAKQSPWTLIGDRSNPIPNDKPCLLLLEDGSVVDDRSDFTELNLLVIAWMPIPTFDEILKANKDVLQRIKEKGD